MRSGKYLDIFYQNVRVLKTKYVKINMCALNFKIIRLTETWLYKCFYSQIPPPPINTVYRSDRDCHTKLRGGRVLIAVCEAVFGAKHRYDLEHF
jgi:hypothetical protein